MPLSDIFFLATLLPDAAVGARRFQDIGLPGWPVIVLSIAALIWTYIPIPEEFELTTFDWTILSAFLAQIIISLLPSHSHTNTYGPNPHEVTP